MAKLETEYMEVSNEVEKTKSEIQRLQVDHDEKERQSELLLMETLKKLERYPISLFICFNDEIAIYILVMIRAMES